MQLIGALVALTAVCVAYMTGTWYLARRRGNVWLSRCWVVSTILVTTLAVISFRLNRHSAAGGPLSTITPTVLFLLTAHGTSLGAATLSLRRSLSRSSDRDLTLAIVGAGLAAFWAAYLLWAVALVALMAPELFTGVVPGPPLR